GPPRTPGEEQRFTLRFQIQLQWPHDLTWRYDTSTGQCALSNLCHPTVHELLDAKRRCLRVGRGLGSIGKSRNRITELRRSGVYQPKIMVQSCSTNRCQRLPCTFLGATRVAYFHSLRVDRVLSLR